MFVYCNAKVIRVAKRGGIIPTYRNNDLNWMFHEGRIGIGVTEFK